MKVYAAIGHFKDNKNMVCVAMTQLTKKAFMQDCYGNEFVPYVVITELMLEKFLACTDCMEIFDQVKKLTSNYRVWNDVTARPLSRLSRKALILPISLSPRFTPHVSPFTAKTSRNSPL